MLNPIAVEDLDSIHRGLGKRGEFDGAVVLVTGCAGFLGAYVMQYLVSYAHALSIRKVIGLDTFLLDKPRWLTDLQATFPEVLQLQAFDVSRDDITAIASADAARYVIHMASIASPSFYRQYPLETIDANIWGLRRLLDFYASSPHLKGLLFFSSSEIYGDPPANAIPTDEEYRGYVACVGPRACYDESKRFGETLCYVFAKTRGMPITIVRPFNNYGPGMRLDDRRLPADFARYVLENRDILVHSDGTPTRTFCYITDAVIGYLQCLLHGKYDYFNIGADKPELSVSEFAEIYRRVGARLFGYAGAIRHEKSRDADYLVDNPNRRCPVIAKAREKLGYAPRVTVEDGVGRYLRYLQHEKDRTP